MTVNRRIISAETIQDRCNNVIQRKNTIATQRTLQEKTASLASILSDMALIQTDVQTLKPARIRTCNPLIHIECWFVEKISYIFAYSKAAEAHKTAVRAHNLATQSFTTAQKELRLFATFESKTLSEDGHSAVEKLPYLEKLAALSSSNAYVKEQLAAHCFKLRLFDDAKKYYLELAQEQKDHLGWKEKLVAITLAKQQYIQAERDAMSLLTYIETAKVNKSHQLQELNIADATVTQYLAEALAKQERFSDAIDQLSSLLKRHEFVKEAYASLRYLIINYRIEEALLLAKTMKSPKEIQNSRLFSQALFEFAKVQPNHKATPAEFSFWIYVYQHFPKTQEIEPLKKYILHELFVLGKGKSVDLNSIQILALLAQAVLKLKDDSNTMRSSMERALTSVAQHGEMGSPLLHSMKKELARSYESDVSGNRGNAFSSLYEQRARLKEIYALFKNNTPQPRLLTSAFSELSALDTSREQTAHAAVAVIEPLALNSSN